MRDMARMVAFLLFLPFLCSATQGVTDICTAVGSYGYACQDYKVTTEDGYVLGLQRIPGVLNGGNPAAPGKQPVLLQHGVLVDGMVWVVRPNGLALSLADAGFDVWIANSRGTRSSRGHTYLNPDYDTQYWSWTWDQLADQDLPATISFVYGLTGQKLHYVGHSLGTLIMLASLAQHRLVEQVKAVALLAPIAHLKHIKLAFAKLAADILGDQLLSLLGGAEFKPQQQLLDVLYNSLCTLPGIDCSNLMTTITGPNCCLDKPAMDMFMRYEPQSTSTRNMVHLAQMIRQDKINMYDYDNIFTNLRNYGWWTPPAYDFSNIPADIPLLLVYGGSDSLSDVRDVTTLVNLLANHQQVGKLSVEYISEYAHADFVMGTNAAERVGAPLTAFLRSNNA